MFEERRKMGIDIYMDWDDQSEEEKRAQFTGFSATAGEVGYLREAYHGGPYVTEYLLTEAFDPEAEAVAIPPKVLRQRLPKALELAEQRQEKIYKDSDPRVLKAFEDFVALYEAKYAEGKNPRILASY